MTSVETSYWGTLKPPLAPSEDDVQVFRENLLPGTGLLLGCTKPLMPLVTEAMDFDPYYEDGRIIRADWSENTTFYTNILADGSFNLGPRKSVDAILEMASRFCKRLIVRSFSFKTEQMRIATYFPTSDDFSITPESVIERDTYRFFVWTFR